MGKNGIETLLLIISAFTFFCILVLLEDKYKWFQQRMDIEQPFPKNYQHTRLTRVKFADDESSNPLVRDKITSNTLHDNKIRQHKELMYHSEKTKFVHDAIGLKYYNAVKGYGLFAKSNINAGEILFVEYPLVKIHDDMSPNMDGWTLMKTVHTGVETARKVDDEFSKVWDRMAKNQKISKQFETLMDGYYHPGIEDLVKVNTNQFAMTSWRKPLGVWGLLSKVNHDLPQNIAAFFGEKKDNYVCITMATTNISKGTELVIDYFLDWFEYNQ
eukprot:174736_1